MLKEENNSKPKLIVVAGCAASGKTTIARFLAKMMGAAYVDKDDATRRFTDLALELNGMSKGDRESDFYLRYLRDTEYDTMFAIAKENLSIGNDAVVSAPFLNVIRDASAWAANGYPTSCDDFDVCIVWVAHDIELEHSRMIGRGATRDGNKLSQWDIYAQSVDGIEPDTEYNAIVVKNPDGGKPEAIAEELHLHIMSDDKNAKNDENGENVNETC